MNAVARADRQVILFWAKVLPLPSGCWEWQGCRNDKGYGDMGSRYGKLYAHQFAHSLCNGDIPAGLDVMHSCDNPPCCNPSHLSVGTRLDNLRDMAAKGRWNNQSVGKTHCKRGHELAGENLAKSYDGSRQCRTCINARKRQRRAAQSEIS